MPSTGFHRPGFLPRTHLEALALPAAEQQGHQAHVLTWHPSGVGELLLAYLEGYWDDLHRYSEAVADLVVEALEGGQDG